MKKKLKIEPKKVVIKGQEDQATTILGCLQVISFEFEKMKFYDNYIFTHKLKQAAKNFEKMIEDVFRLYYQKATPEETDTSMNLINKLCGVITAEIHVNYQLADMPKETIDNYLKERCELMKKYNLLSADFILD